MQYFKKSLALLLAVLMLLSTLTLVSVAAEGDTTDPAGQTSGESGTVPPHAHQYDKSGAPYVEHKDATCTETGLNRGWKCTYPGCTYINYENGTAIIPAKGHTEVPIPAKAPTCTEKGNTAGVKCSVCDTVLTATTEINALGHDWGDWVTLREPVSCKTPGQREHTCKRCGETARELIPAAEHKPVNVEAKPATCTTDGNKAGTKCSVCGTVLSGCEKITAEGHKYEKVKTVEPSCEEVGKTTYKCSVCGDTYDGDVKPALGHDIVIDEAVAPTCKEDGKTEGKHCKRCNTVFVKQEVIPKDEKYHDWEIVPAVAPTCTEKGSTEGKKCKICGKVESEVKVLEAKGHNFTTEVITPVSCEANGLTKKYCVECNVSETVVVAATGHKFGDWIYSDNFSCENGGERWQICENCGETFNREQLPASGHKWSKEWTIDTPATCTKRGYKSHHCTVCDAKTDITTVAKTPHQYLDTVTKATTKKNGLVTGVCKVCGLERKPIKVRRVKSFALSKTAYTYDGKAKKPTVVVKDADGNKLKNGTDYKVTYASGRKKVGTYTVKIKLTGYYSGSKTLKFTIKLATPKGLEAKTNAAKKTIKLSWDAVKGAKKYVIYCATEKDGDYKKLATAKKTAYSIKTLDPGTYYFKVRALTVNNKSKNAYSAYSSPLKVKLAKAK